MWTNEHTAETTLDRETVWAALRDLHTGTLTYEGADTFELQGPFAVGTELIVTPVGQDPFPSTIVDLVENETYADRTEFGTLVLTFRHTLVPIDNGTRVTHRLEIDGEGADEVGAELGPQISADFPESMEALFDAARRRA
ncbi:polyketide cyclase [Diaminobutyricibacter sp. McL0608]|uniref:polyketide cyclase n=1 Tax=Leifsonia sp. McL0608 TaxID=3143537 RepID=UPI0031F31D72